MEAIRTKTRSTPQKYDYFPKANVCSTVCYYTSCVQQKIQKYLGIRRMSVPHRTLQSIRMQLQWWNIVQVQNFHSIAELCIKNGM